MWGFKLVFKLCFKPSSCLLCELMENIEWIIAHNYSWNCELKLKLRVKIHSHKFVEVQTKPEISWLQRDSSTLAWWRLENVFNLVMKPPKAICLFYRVCICLRGTLLPPNWPLYKFFLQYQCILKEKKETNHAFDLVRNSLNVPYMKHVAIS